MYRKGKIMTKRRKDEGLRTRNPGLQGESGERHGQNTPGAQFDAHEGATAPSGETPDLQGGYGRRGFGATGHGSGGYAGLGAFQIEADSEGGDLRATSEPRTHKAEDDTRGESESDK